MTWRRFCACYPRRRMKKSSPDVKTYSGGFHAPKRTNNMNASVIAALEAWQGNLALHFHSFLHWLPAFALTPVFALTPCFCIGSLFLQWLPVFALTPCFCIGSLFLQWLPVFAMGPCFCTYSLFLQWLPVFEVASCFCTCSLFLHRLPVFALAPCFRIGSLCCTNSLWKKAFGRKSPTSTGKNSWLKLENKLLNLKWTSWEWNMRVFSIFALVFTEQYFQSSRRAFCLTHQVGFNSGCNVLK